MFERYRRVIACVCLCIGLGGSICSVDAQVGRLTMSQFRAGGNAMDAADKQMTVAAEALSKVIASAGLTQEQMGQLVGSAPWTLQAIVDQMGSENQFSGSDLTRARRALSNAQAKYYEAINAFQTIEAQNPNLADPIWLKGLMLICIGNGSPALQELEKARGMGGAGIQVLLSGEMASVLDQPITADKIPEVAATVVLASRRTPLNAKVSGSGGYSLSYSARGITFDFNEAQLSTQRAAAEEVDLFAGIDDPPTPDPPTPRPVDQAAGQADKAAAPVADPAGQAAGQAADPADQAAGQADKAAAPVADPAGQAANQAADPVGQAAGQADKAAAPVADPAGQAVGEAKPVRRHVPDLPDNKPENPTPISPPLESVVTQETPPPQTVTTEIKIEYSVPEWQRRFAASRLNKTVSSEDSLNALFALEAGRRALLRGSLIGGVRVPSVEQAREEAEARLNQGLVANKVTRFDLEDLFKDQAFPIPLRTFLNELEREYENNVYGAARDRYWLIMSKLENSNKNYAEAIKLHPRLLDAYIEKIRIALDMGWESEVIRLYEVARFLPISHLQPEEDTRRAQFDLDPLGDVVEETVFKVAQVYYQNQDLVENIRIGLKSEAAVDVVATAVDTTKLVTEDEPFAIVEKFMQDRANILESFKDDMPDDSEMLTKVKNIEIWNGFTLVRFHSSVGWKTDAKQLLTKERQKLGATFVNEPKYAEVRGLVDQLERAIDAQRETVTIDFEVGEKLVSALNLRAKLNFVGDEGKGSPFATTQTLDLRLIPGERADVDFKKIVATTFVNQETFRLPEAAYKVTVEIQSLPILTANEFPIQFIHKKRNGRFSEFLQPSRIELVVLNDKGEKIADKMLTNFFQAGDRIQPISPDDEIDGERLSFPVGTANVKIEFNDVPYVSAWGNLFGLQMKETIDVGDDFEEKLTRLTRGTIGVIPLLFFVF